jgi:hypothetical protein
MCRKDEEETGGRRTKLCGKIQLVRGVDYMCGG